MKQQQLFDHRPTLDASAADAGKRDGMARVMRRAPDDWVKEFNVWLHTFAKVRRPFISEEVLAVVGVPVGTDPRAVGPLFSVAQRSGLIRPTGRYVKGHSASRHGAPVREWIGTA
jgi:hypothetical protein